jgi:hypothetical protein
VSESTASSFGSTPLADLPSRWSPLRKKAPPTSLTTRIGRLPPPPAPPRLRAYFAPTAGDEGEAADEHDAHDPLGAGSDSAWNRKRVVGERIW